MQDLHQFLSAIHFTDYHEEPYANPLQMGNFISAYPDSDFDLTAADIVLLGCGEWRGNNENKAYSDAADAVRKAFYSLYNWHPEIKIADLGNVMEGASLADSRAALLTVLKEIHQLGKIAVLIGGSQDLSLQQYQVFKLQEKTIDVAVIDKTIDLEESETITDKSYLMELLTGEPNFVKNYSHIGFQSYEVNPKILETLDKLRFDFYRLGVVRDNLEDMEPVLRSTNLLSIDMSALRKSDAPFLKNASPNGFFGDELCQLAKYAGMAPNLSALGIFGYRPEDDTGQQGAKLIAQMLWYFIDGLRIRKMEAPAEKAEDYLVYNVHFTDNDCVFIKSKITQRWWMQMPDNSFIPCSYSDYEQALNNEVPERWLRAQERLL